MVKINKHLYKINIYKSLLWNIKKKQNFNKSLVESILYSDNDLKFIIVNGDEIKKMLISHRENMSLTVINFLNELKFLGESIKEEPQKLINNPPIINVNNLYGQEQLYDVENKIDTPECNLMKEFNSIIGKLNFCVKEIKIMNNIIDNIGINKDYKLPINLFQKLKKF